MFDKDQGLICMHKNYAHGSMRLETSTMENLHILKKLCHRAVDHKSGSLTG